MNVQAELRRMVDDRAPLEQAADRGHPRACLLAARTASPGDLRVVSWLTTAHRAGEKHDDSDLVPAERLAAAALLGRTNRHTNPELARAWYRRALPNVDWAEPPESEWSTSGLRVAAEYASWLHDSGHPEDAARWCATLTSEAYRNTWADRLTLSEEADKTWRYDYGSAQGNDRTRYTMLKHRLDAHPLSVADRWETLARLADTAHFEAHQHEPALRAWVRGALDAAGSGEQPVWEGASLSLADVTAGHAWGFVDWIHGTALPMALETAGFGSLNELKDAAANARTEREQHLAHAALYRARRQRRDALVEVVAASGLGGHLDPRGYVIDLAERQSPPMFRLMRGEPLWFASWLTTDPDRGASGWTRASELAGGALVSALVGVTDIRGEEEAMQIAAQLWDESQALLRTWVGPAGHQNQG